MASGKANSDRLGRRGASLAWARGASLPSWGLSLLVHAALLAGLATVSWHAAAALNEPEVQVGIVVKERGPEGPVYNGKRERYEVSRPGERQAVQEPVPDSDSVELLLPESPAVDPSVIGLSGVSVPGTAELAAVPEPSLVPAGAAKVGFFGASVWGRHFVFVIDRSGSMSQRDALDMAKRELLASLAQLPEHTKFQIVFYNDRARLMPVPGGGTRLLPATRANKLLARRFLESIMAEGGTDHVAALEPALRMRPDVIFFLTDADDMSMEDVNYITAQNVGHARIHAIEFGIGKEIDQQTALRELAERNGGTYRYVDVDRLSGR